MRTNYKNILRILVIVLLDILAIVGCGGVAMLVRFDFSIGNIPVEMKNLLADFLKVQIAVTLAVFMIRKMYHYVWRSVSVYDVADMIISVVLAIAAPPVAGAALTCYTILFIQLGIPTDAIAVIIALNVILEFVATAANLFCLQTTMVELSGDLELLDADCLRK